jgi:5-methylcytosine-specific restriction protein B
VADVVNKVNSGLRVRFGPHLEVGPSYFMRADSNKNLLRRVWDYDVMPFLEDVLFGHEEELEKFKLHKLKESDNAGDSTGRTPAEPDIPEEG